MPDVQDSSYLSELGAHCDLSFTKVSGRDEPMTQFRAFPKFEIRCRLFLKGSVKILEHIYSFSSFSMSDSGASCWTFVRNESFFIAVATASISRKS